MFLKSIYQYLVIKRSGLFDENYYRNTFSRPSELKGYPLFHYITAGWKEGRNPSKIFHTKYYLENNDDVLKSGVNPLFHYINYGGFENRDPSPDFSSQYYLAIHTDVKKSKINPLVHYHKFGQFENRSVNSDYEIKLFPDYLPGSSSKNRNEYKYENIYSELLKLETTSIVDIIICVGQNHKNIEACLASIRQNTKKNTYKLHLVVHEKDYLEIRKFLPDDIQIHLHHMNLFNFAKANNLVLKQSENDAILLNDDTEVTEGWLEKLRHASKGIALTGARTGFHRAGNPQSYGEGPVKVTNYPINMFCAYIPVRLRAIIGLLDEEFVYYGGEDVDYSIRALQNGVPLVISDAFVIHKESQTFGDTKEILIVESDKMIFERYQILSPFNLCEIKPKASVIVTSRNRPKLLELALKSIRNITYDHFEIIVVDDNSNPETNRLLLEQQTKYGDLISIRLPKNWGTSEARALGLRAANGQFVLFADDDDTVFPNRIIAPLLCISKNPILDVVYCNFNVISEDGKITPIYCQPYHEQAYLNLEFVIGSGILFGRKNTFLDVPFYSRFNYAVDYDWVFRLRRMGYTIDLCPEIVMNYNRSGPAELHLAGTETSNKQHKEIFEREKLLHEIKRKD